MARTYGELYRDASQLGIYEEVKDLGYHELRVAVNKAREKAEESNIEIVDDGAQSGTAQVQEAPEVTARGTDEKRDIHIVATYKTRTPEGDRVENTYEARGTSPRNVLDNMEFPKGINILVNATVTEGDYSFSRALASHQARSLFEEKNDALLCKLFGLHA